MKIEAYQAKFSIMILTDFLELYVCSVYLHLLKKYQTCK